MIPTGNSSRISPRRQNHAALIALDAAEKGGCSKRVNGLPAPEQINFPTPWREVLNIAKPSTRRGSQNERRSAGKKSPVFISVLEFLTFQTQYVRLLLSLWGVLADDGGSDAGGNCGNGLKDGVHETDYSTFRKFVKDKKMALKLKMTSMWVQPDHWKQFGALAQSQGISASNLLRLMIAKELRRAAREARQDRVGE